MTFKYRCVIHRCMWGSGLSPFDPTTYSRVRWIVEFPASGCKNSFDSSFEFRMKFQRNSCSDHPFKTLANFHTFWPLSPYCWHFFSIVCRQIWQIFDPSPPKVCRRLKWMVPYFVNWHSLVPMKIGHNLEIINISKFKVC